MFAQTGDLVGIGNEKWVGWLGCLALLGILGIVLVQLKPMISEKISDSKSNQIEENKKIKMRIE